MTHKHNDLLACYTLEATGSVPIIALNPNTFAIWQEQQPQRVRNWLATIQFTARANTLCLLPDDQGKLQQVICGYEKTNEVWILAYLYTQLPGGRYQLEGKEAELLYESAALTWGLASYQYTRYKTNTLQTNINATSTTILKQLVLPSAEMAQSINQMVKSIYLVRDLTNTPSEDMGPENLMAAAVELTHCYGGDVQQTVGDALQQNFPLVYHVGRASHRPPCVIDMKWGKPHHPRVTLVGKGVCFDSGGLDLKSSSGMRLMKKDMGGAAHALGLAQLIMASQLPVQLRVIIPAVDNVVAGNAYRPGDVIVSRKGISVEIDNTDAEGRLVLADAITLACEESPVLLIDFATLTGAARVAVGTDFPAMFCNDDELADALLKSARQSLDPLWQLPLYQPYRDCLKSGIADIANSAPSSYAGAITAALFLQQFVDETIPWAHLDMMAWNLNSRPGRPEGAEAMGLRAVYDYLVKRFGI